MSKWDSIYRKVPEVSSGHPFGGGIWDNLQISLMDYYDNRNGSNSWFLDMTDTMRYNPDNIEITLRKAKNAERPHASHHGQW